MAAPQEVLDALRRAQDGGSDPAAPPGMLADTGMGAARGAANAATSLAGMPADLANLLSRYMPQGSIPFLPTMGRPSIPPQEGRAVPSPQSWGGNEDIRSLARMIPGAGSVLDYRPQTMPGRFAQAGMEWGVPAMLAGPGSLARRFVTGAAGGAAGEAASELAMPFVPAAARPYADPVIRGAAGMGTMALMNRPLMSRSNSSDVVREATGDVTPADWQRAQQRMAAADAAGVRLLPAEALGEVGGPLQGITSDIVASRAGGPVQRVLSGRRDEVRAAGENAIASVGGPRRAPADVVRDVSEGARNTIQQARTARTQASEPHYSAAELQPVPPGALDHVLAQIDDRIARVGAESDIGRALADLRGRLTADQNVGPLSTLAQETRAGLYPRPPGQTATVTPPRAMTSREQGVIGPMVRETTETLERVNPNFATAQDLYRANSPRVDSLRQPEVLGNLQGPVTETGRLPATLARQTEIIAGDATTPQQIARVFGEIGTSNRPQAARDLGATLLRRELDTAARVAPTSPDAPLTGARFWSAIMETPDTASRTEAIVRGMAQANGQNPDRAWTGFSRLLDVFEQTGRIPAVGSRTAPREALARAAGSNWGSTALDTLNVTRGSFLRNASTALAERAAAADYADLARALSRPDGLQILQNMAGQFPNSARARAIATRFLEIGANRPAEPQR